MKKTLNKLKDWALFWIWFLIILWISNAWVNLWEVSSWDSLTSTIWNDLVWKINENGNKLEWLSNTWWKLTMNWVIESTIWWIKFPDGTTQTTATIWTTDTNAGTICSVWEYLDWDGTCKAERYNSTYDTEAEIDAAISNNGYISSFTELDPQVWSNTTNYLSKWNWTSLGTSTIFDNWNVWIGTWTPWQKLDVVWAIKSDYIIVDPQWWPGEWWEIALYWEGSYGNIQIDNYQWNARIHTLASWKIFDIVGWNWLRANWADMNSNKIVNVTNPTAAQDVATKDYVDSAVSSAWWASSSYSQTNCVWKYITTCWHNCWNGNGYSQTCWAWYYMAWFALNTWSQYSAYNFRIYCCQ